MTYDRGAALRKLRKNAALRQIPMAYLRKGDRLIAVRDFGAGGIQMYTAVADMDGHRVSESYGYRAGTDYYEDPQKDYINVKFDGQDYDDSLRPNETMYEREGWVVFVTQEIYDRYLEDRKFDREKEKEKTAERQKLDELFKEIDRLQERAREIKARLDS